MPSGGKVNWSMIGTVVGVLFALVGSAWGIVTYHNGDFRELQQAHDAIRETHTRDCQEIRAKQVSALEHLTERTVSKAHLQAELRAVSAEVRALQVQQTNSAAHMDKRLDDLMRAVRSDRRHR